MRDNDGNSNRATDSATEATENTEAIALLRVLGVLCGPSRALRRSLRRFLLPYTRSSEVRPRMQQSRWVHSGRAARNLAHRHHRHRAGARFYRRICGGSVAVAAAGGLSFGGHRDGAIHAGVCRRSSSRLPTRGDRRHPADVRCRDAFFRGRSLGGAIDCAAGGDCANRGGDGARRGRGLDVGWSFGAGLVFGLALSVASTVVLLRGAGILGPGRYARWKDRDRLADRGGPGDGARARRAARAGRSARRNSPARPCRRRQSLAVTRHHARQGGVVCRADARGRLARVSVVAPARGEHGLARTFHPRRRGARARRGFRLGETLRRVVCLGRVFLPAWSSTSQT